MANDLKVNIRGDGSQLSSELTRTASEVAKLERQAKQAQKELNNMNKSANNLKGGLKDLIGGISNLDFSSISNGISSIGENASSVLPNLGKMATSLVNPYTLAGTAILGAGKALFDYNVELEKTLQRTAQFTGLSGDELMSLRNGIKSVADTFGKDYNDVLSSVDGLMCQFGISGEEALTIIKNGFVGGCDDGGKMLDLISKYSGSFKDAGISASELVAIIGNTRSGIFNEDGIELISKGATKIREFSSTLQSSLDAIGISSKEMYAKLQSGEITTVQALQSISSKLKELNPQSKEVGDVLSSVFGKQGAKAGYELVTALADVETNLDKVKEQTGDWGVAMEQLQQAVREFENALSSLFGIADGGFSTMTTKLKADVYGAVAKVINGFIDWYNKSIVVRYAIQSIAVTFKNAWEIIKGILKLFMNGLENLADLIEGVLTLDWNKVKGAWKNGISNIMKTVADGFENVKNNVKKGVDSINNGKIEKIEASYSANNNKKSTSTNKGKGSSSKNSSNKGTTRTEVIKTQLEINTEQFRKQESELNKLIDGFNIGQVNIDELDKGYKEYLKYCEEHKIPIRTELKIDKDELGYKVAKMKPIEVKSELEYKKEGFEKVQKELNSTLDDFNKGLIDLPMLISKWGQFKKYCEDNSIKLDTELNIETDNLGNTTASISPITSDLDKLRETLNNTKAEVNQLKNDFNDGLIDSSTLETEIDRINSLLRSIGAEPYVIKFNVDGIDIIDEATDKLNKAREAEERQKEMISNVSSSFSNLGSVIGGTSGEFMKFAGKSIEAINSMIPQIVALIGAKEGEALASGTASAAAMPFPANIAAIASIVATITGLFASFAGSFADGGIIGGATTIGDFNIARVNKGEMILNGRQQSRLFNLLDGNGYYSDSVSSGSVSFRIHGKELIGVLNNYNKKTNKVR